MNILRKFVFVSLMIALTSCSESGNTMSTTTVPTYVPTTTVSAPDCSQPALERTVGEKTYVLGCSADWAALQPFSWECGEHCFAFIYKWEQTKWSLKMKCDQYQTLSIEGWCEGMQGDISDGNYTGSVAEFPPNDIACQIWVKSMYAEYEKKTSCS